MMYWISVLPHDRQAILTPCCGATTISAAGGLLGRVSTAVASAREVVPFSRESDIVSPKLVCISSCLGVFGVACGCYDVLPAVVLSITIKS